MWARKRSRHEEHRLGSCSNHRCWWYVYRQEREASCRSRSLLSPAPLHVRRVRWLFLGKLSSYDDQTYLLRISEWKSVAVKRKWWSVLSAFVENRSTRLLLPQNYKVFMAKSEGKSIRNEKQKTLEQDTQLIKTLREANWGKRGSANAAEYLYEPPPLSLACRSWASHAPAATTHRPLIIENGILP